MPVSPVTVALIGFIAAIASLAGVYLIQCSLARFAKARVRAT
jgi:hypothetical protein